MTGNKTLSFTGRAKEEIFTSRPLKGSRWLSFAYGLFLFGAHTGDGNITFLTEHKSVSMCYSEAFRMLTGGRLDYGRSEGARATYRSYCSNAELIATLWERFRFNENSPLSADHLLEEGAKAAFLSGAFMACASVTEPSKEYHLSFKPARESAGDCLFELLSELGYPPKSALYRGMQMIYFKESEPIEDILTAVGAPICSLELMETKVLKDLRNKANRITNAETANIDKTVKSAQNQIEDIRYIYSHGQAENLPPELSEMAEVRLQNPEASLRELGKLLSEPVSRSGVNHRMKRLAELADALRVKESR